MNIRKYVTLSTALVVVYAMFVVSPQPAKAQGGIVANSLTSSSYGTFGGVAYTKYVGRFAGLAAGDYDVPFEIIAPADPAQGNGIVVLEPFHPVTGGAIGRDAYLTAPFFFERGFSYAALAWYPEDSNPMVDYSDEEALEILHNFAVALRDDATLVGVVGDMQKLYAIGVSKTCSPLFTFLDSPAGGLIDFAFLTGPSWPHNGYEKPAGTKYVMVFLAEADLVLSEMQSKHQDTLRGSSSTYRSYEVAGGPHVPETPIMQAMGAQMGIPMFGGLDWAPVARALFMAGHRWVTEGLTPPPSARLAEGSKDENDAVYQSRYGLELKTGIARDENGNALGGIRLPDIEVGRAQYVAVEPSSWGGGLMGASIDLACEPKADGSTRFPDHDSYVSQVTHHAQKLVAEGYLLQEDADALIATAQGSTVGTAEGCASAPETAAAALPETGGTPFPTHIVMMVLGGLALSSGLGLRLLRRREAAGD